MRALHIDHMPQIKRWVHADRKKHREALAQAATRLTKVLLRQPRDTDRLRRALKRLRHPKHGVRGLIASPLSFVAALDDKGIVLARGAEPDRLQGRDFAKPFNPVRTALSAGKAQQGLVDFAAASQPRKKPRPSMLFVEPVQHQGKPLGALVLGIPLARWAQRLSRQLQLEHGDEVGLTLWAYFYRGGLLFEKGTPPELDDALPDAGARAALLRQAPRGFVRALDMHGRSYGWGMLPLPALGDDVGVLLVRAEAP